VIGGAKGDPLTQVTGTLSSRFWCARLVDIATKSIRK
jgi:hypothetical protein